MRRFTLRDLFWLTLVVAMGVAWWLDNRDGQRDRQTLESHSVLWQTKAERLGEVLEDWGWIVNLNHDDPDQWAILIRCLD